ncbi:MAG: hypothetical protein H6P96_1233 [Candidatus Aminicenantes bacterium]|nr:hypothetical protein [Candidatus Aminicenantes bacterium]
MKKRCVVLCAVVLLLAAFAAGPAAAAVDFDLGIKAGVSMATYKWTGGEASGSLTKPVFGVFFAYNINRNFAIQPEAYYLTQGGTWTDVYDSTTYKYVDRWNYIHVPVLAKYRFMPDKKLTPILFAGPAVGFLLSAHYKYFVNDFEEFDKDIKMWMNKTNFSAVFGAGVEYKMDKLMLILDIRYDLGLTNIDGDDDPTDQEKTRAFMFMVGVGF